MHPSLRGYAIAVVQSAADAGASPQVADELAEVEDLFAREGRLTAVLTDSVVPVAVAPGRDRGAARQPGARPRPCGS